MKIPSRSTIFVFSTLGFAATSQAAVLFNDDFESYAPDTTISANANQWVNASGLASYRTVRDSPTPFGASNQYLQLADVGSSATTGDGQFIRLQSKEITGASGAVTTLSFDFYEPSTGGNGNMIVGYSRLGGDLNSAGRRLSFNLNNGNVTGLTTTVSNTYSLDTSYTIFIIFNDTAAAVSYLGGTLDATSADVWLEEFGSGTYVKAGTISAFNDQTASYRVGFRTFAAPVQEMWVDNFVLQEGALAIPEPSAFLLAGIGAFAFMRRRR